MEPGTPPKLTGAAAADAAAKAIDAAVTQRGEKLVDLSEQGTVMLVFLRHSGCTFCRETLADIAARRGQAAFAKIRIVLVHMGDQEGIDALLRKYNLDGIDCIGDAEQKLYQVFGLKRGRIGQLLGPKVWWRGIQAGILAGHGLGKPTADPTQMPGVFLLKHSSVAGSFRHRSAADRPDYLAICAPHASQ